MSNEFKGLSRAISLWNGSRLDLFEISQPDKNGEFHGVIRFYHQDSSRDGKYATKCVRVSNTASTIDVIETLSEKFRSDMRMLTKPNYALYEVHANGESRKLRNNEFPLTVQLSWVKDDREGRFLMRNEDDKRPVHIGNGLYDKSEDTVKGFKLTRNLTKKEKKQMKKKEKVKQKEEVVLPNQMSQEESAAKHLYNEVPESTFTRTVSNPEAVMKKRREQKLQKRGAELLKIYGDSINKEIPYKTLLLLPTDDTDTVIRAALDKYGLGREKTADYMMVQVVLPPGSKPEECFEGGWGKETILGPEHCPLDIEQKWQPHQGTLVFQLRKSSSNYAAKKKQKPASQTRADDRNYKNEQKSKPRNQDRPRKTSARVDYENVPQPSKRPKLLEILASDKVVTHSIAPNVTEMGGDRRKASYGPFIELQQKQGLLPSHCVITNMDGVVTVTPHDNDGEVFVDGKIIEETTMLSHGNVVWLGRGKHLVFCQSDKDISISEIQKKIRATAPRDHGAQNHDASQRNGSTTNTSANRPRHHSATSSSSSKSGSVSHSRGQLADQTSLPNIRENRTYEPQMRRPQSQLPLTKPSPEKTFPHRTPQTATVQPIQQTLHHKLPASITVTDDAEESLITEILSARANPLHFKLSPSYCIYLIERYFVETDRKKILPNLLLTTDLLEQNIQMNGSSVSELSFWMANASELLNFIRQDQDLTSVTVEIQGSFAKTVQLSFRQLVQCMQRTLFDLMPAFLSNSDEDLPGGNDQVDLKKQNQNADGPTMYDILHMLSSAMSLLRRCRVNAALTIQLFSQLFHSINMWLFNKLVASTESRTLCCSVWGMRIRARLGMVEMWAEKQGLELAADCHLARITQATHLLQAPKRSGEDIAAISGTSFKLNSLQLRVLLTNYQPDEREGEIWISQELIDKVVAVAESSADELTRSDGRDIQLEEDPDLQLPFLLPEDGYSCDVIHGVPSGLTEFLQPLQKDGLCVFEIEPESSGAWTVHFQSILQQYQNVVRSAREREQVAKPEVISITFNKKGGGMGLSIVAAKGVGLDKLGIYIRSVVPGGASDLDGRLEPGDQLLSVDGQSLVGVDQARAAELMTHTGQTVTLEVAKQGAVHHGLATLLSQTAKMPQSQPPQSRTNPDHSQARPRSDGYALHPTGPNSQPSGRPSAREQLFGGQGRSSAAQNMPKSALNHSTPHLNVQPNAKEPVRPVTNNTPRSAISMGNLQKPQSEVDSTRNFKDHYSPYGREQTPVSNNVRRKAASQSTLVPSEQQRRQNELVNAYDKRSIPSPSAQDPLPSPPRATEKYPQNSIDNPNYEHFPSPPPELIQDPYETKDSSRRHFRPVEPVVSGPTKSPPAQESNQRLRKSVTPPRKEESSTPSSVGTKTLDRPSSAKKTEVARIAPTMKKKQQTPPPSSKSATLPRHFKSTSPWDRDEREKQQQSIQEQLNALRDEEIEELTARNDLSSLEQDRLKNLLQEKEFQARVQEEKMKMFSDDDPSEEDYSVPDRPDRDRLIRIEGAHALRDAAARMNTEQEDEGHARWKEEQERKKREAELREKKLEGRREERKRDRERAEKERLEEKKRLERQQLEEMKRYEEEQKKEEEWRRNYNSLQREEEEQRRRLEEIRRMREEEEKQLVELQAKRQAEERSLRQESVLRRQEEKQAKQRQVEAKEEAEREFLEQKLSAGKPSGFVSSYKKYAPVSPRAAPSAGVQQTKPFYKSAVSPVATSSNQHSPPFDPSYSRPAMRENTRPHSARPVSDGYALGKSDWSSENLPPKLDPTTPPASYTDRRPVSYVSSAITPKVIGAQEIYNDPRNRREATLKRDQSMKRRGPDPSRMTFKDRQRMFQGGTSSPTTKPKSSRKLLELEESLRGQI